MMRALQLLGSLLIGAVAMNGSVAEERTPPPLDNPKLIKRAPLEWPKDAKKLKLEASIDLFGVLTEQGQLVELEERSCQINKRGQPPDKKLKHHCESFVAAAKRTVSKWRYKPARLRGEPTSVFITVKLKFELR